MSAGTKSGIETEIKLRVADARQAQRLLRAAGYKLLRRRIFEANIVFDTAHLAYRNRGELIRLREVGSRCLLTYKGKPTPGRHKSREEIEVDIAEAAPFIQILARLGLEPVFRYEKYRTEYQRPRSTGLATLDETPIGVFVELEGAPAWIDASARELGFSQADYITLSYGGLYQQYLASNPQGSPDMVFR